MGDWECNGSSHVDYFDNLLKTTEAGEQDGRRFGEQLMERVKKRKFGDSKVEVVREYIAANRALREIQSSMVS